MPTNADADGFWSAMPRQNSQRQGRALVQSLFLGGSSTSPMSAMRSGVIPTTSDGTQAYDLRVTVQSGRTLLVQAGSAVVGRSGQGGYLTWELPAARTVTCDAAPATNPRNDIVVLRVYDTTLSDIIQGGGTIPARVEIVTGTPGATPVDPVTWDSLGLITTGLGTGSGVAIPLARAQVSTGGVVTLSDLRRGTGVIGGVRVLLPGDSLSDPSFMPGDIRWFNGLDFWDGTAWNELGRARIGGEYQANAQQTMGAAPGAPATKMNFGAAVQAASGITWNGSNQFTVVTAGVYTGYAAANTGFSPTGNWGVGIHSGAGIPGATTPWISAPLFASGQTDSFASFTKYLDVGQTLSAYFYNNETATRLINTASSKPAVFRVWRGR